MCQSESFDINFKYKIIFKIDFIKIKIIKLYKFIRFQHLIYFVILINLTSIFILII